MVTSRTVVTVVAGALLCCSTTLALPKRPSSIHAVYPPNDNNNESQPDRILLAYHKDTSTKDNSDNTRIKNKKTKNKNSSKKKNSSRAVTKADDKDDNDNSGTLANQYKKKLRKVISIPTSTPLFTVVGNVQVGFFLAALWLYKSKLWFCSLLA